MKKFLLPIVITVLSLISFETKAQCDTVAQVCYKFVEDGYISDGQEYRALLINDETAEFYTTFYGGATYRVAGCSGFSEGNLIFRIFDAERNLLFDNQTYQNAGYWDFTFTDTQDCTIEAQLDNSAAGSGCAVLLINFKQ